jgi:hypothetical protein
MPDKRPDPYVYGELVVGSVPAGAEDGQEAKYAFPLELPSKVRSACTKTATPAETALLGVAFMMLVHTLDEFILKNIPSPSFPIAFEVSVFDFPSKFLNAIVAWLLEVIPAIVLFFLL